MRLKLGPRIDGIQLATTPPVPAPDAPASLEKRDVEITARIAHVGETEPGRFTVVLDLEIPAYSLETHHRLVSVSGVLLPVEFPAPATAEEFLTGAHPTASLGVSMLQDGGLVSLSMSGAPAGQSWIQVILTFED